MYFKRLEMQGFKSFADSSVIELNNGITCIVGPNGTGKSNISDAMRWVLGEQSPKQLRGLKMDEVIFSGASGRKPKSFAEVTLVIDNSTGILDLDYTEVAITRRLYRSGESEYLINNNPCRLKDIKLLIMDTGIGVDGYSIIGQGNINDIISTKPIERRAIFEEAAGIVLYKSRKTETENKLRDANVNLSRVRDIILELDGRVKTLKEESEKAETFINLRQRHKKLGINILLKNIDNMSKTLNLQSEERIEIEEESERLSKELEIINSKAEAIRNESGVLSINSEDNNTNLINIIEELNKIESFGEVSVEKLQSMDREIERFENEILKLKEKLHEENQNLDNLKEEEKKLGNEKKLCEEELSKALLKFTDDKSKVLRQKKEIDDNKDEIIKLSNSIVSKKAEINTLESYLEKINLENEKLIETSTGKDKERKDKENEFISLKEGLDKKKTEKIEIEKEMVAISAEIAKIEKDIEKSYIDLDVFKGEMHKKLARKNTINEMEQNYEGYNYAVKFLMKSNLSGICGTVSDIIEVPGGYEQAIETALGGSLQNIITEKDENAKKAINILKSEKAGRATFLPIETIHGKKANISNEIIEFDGYLGIGSEICKTANVYDGIIDFLLGRTLIVENMDLGIKLSKKVGNGIRIVTLDGEVIASGGAITGGKYKNKTANFIERKKEIIELENKIKNIEEDIEKKKKFQSEIITQKEELKKKRDAFFEKLRETDIEIRLIDEKVANINSILVSWENDKKRIYDDISINKNDIDKAKTLIQKHKDDVDIFTKKIKDIESITEKLIVENENDSNIIESDNEDIVTKRIKVNENNTKELALNERIEETIDEVSQLEEDIAEKNEKLKSIINEKDMIIGSSDEAKGNLKDLKLKREDLENKKKEIIDRIKILEEEEKENTEKKEKTENKISYLRDEKYKIEVKEAKNQTILESQKEKLWDEFEVSYAEALELKDEDIQIGKARKEDSEIKSEMSAMGEVNILSIDEYKEVSKRYEFMQAQEKDLIDAREELTDIISNIDKTMTKKFVENFNEVVLHFEKIFKDLFGGGSAEIRLVDENDPLNSGIEIIAEPPGKKLQNINLLSGGEKTLIAIALMFAVLKAKPTPFCILDEVDANLDESNVEEFSKYLKNFSEIQFALITHRRATMEHAGALYGISMPERGISRLISLKL